MIGLTASLMAAGIGALVSAPLWLLIAWRFDRRRSLWLEGDCLVDDVGGRLTRLPLGEVREVKRDWIVEAGHQLVLVGRAGQRVSIMPEPQNAELRRAIGTRLVALGRRTAVHTSEARSLLGMSP